MNEAGHNITNNIENYSSSLTTSSSSLSTTNFNNKKYLEELVEEEEEADNISQTSNQNHQMTFLLLA